MTDDLFTYGRPARGKSFTDREKESRILAANFKGGINTILVSPRRWGKTSLVLKVIDEVRSKELIPVFVDVFRCKNARDFCECIGSAVANQVGGKTDEILEHIRGFLSRFSIGVNLNPDPSNPVSLQLGMDSKETDFDAILELPQKTAEKKGYRILLCIDEFQQVTEFEDSLAFQKRLRSIWQHQSNVTYCLFGSKKHMMDQLFDSPSKPFYKFGDMLNLETIPLEFWRPFIQNRFKEGGKTISDEICRKICETVEFNSFYVQQLSWILFRNSGEEATEEALREAVEEIIFQNASLFEARTEGLTSYQMNFLRAVSDGVTKGFSSKAIIDKYRLGSSANVVSLRKVLLEKDLLSKYRGEIRLSDPVLGMWMRK